MDYREKKKRLVRHMVWMLLAAFGWIAVMPAMAQTIKGHRLPNIAVGIHHHHPDTTLCSPLNIGLISEVTPCTVFNMVCCWELRAATPTV